MPYNTANTCQQMNRCNTNNSNVQLPTSSNVQGVNVLPLPITVPVPIVPTELFSHPLTVSPVPTMSTTAQGNVGTMIQTQQQQHQQLQHQQQQSQQQAPTRQNGNPPDLVPFQMCPHQADILYNEIEPSANQQQRSSQNWKRPFLWFSIGDLRWNSSVKELIFEVEKKFDRGFVQDGMDIEERSFDRCESKRVMQFYSRLAQERDTKNFVFLYKCEMYVQKIFRVRSDIVFVTQIIAQMMRTSVCFDRASRSYLR